jgi:hypothetical protein
MILENRVCDRKAGANVVKVFTGDESHVVSYIYIYIYISHGEVR